MAKHVADWLAPIVRRAQLVYMIEVAAGTTRDPVLISLDELPGSVG